MELASSPRRNGGFPDPPAGLAVRKVLARHEECGAVTPMQIPAELPPRALRRIVCDGCGRDYEPAGVEETVGEESPPAPVTVAADHAAAISTAPLADLADRVAIAWAELVDRAAAIPRPELPDWLYDPDSRTWKLVSAVAAAALVIAALVLLRGDEEPAAPTAATPPAALERPAGPTGGRDGKHRPGGASFVRESTFSLALPTGWKRSGGEAGATFTATAPGGAADASLWIDRDPGLDFAAFEQRSLEQLRTLAGSARVLERIAAPTAEGTIVRLAADAPEGSPAFEVTLRAAGPFRYYLATTVQPDASAADVDAAELIHGSFQPAPGAK